MSEKSPLAGYFPLPYGIQAFRLVFYLLVLAFMLFLLVTGVQRFSVQDSVFPVLIGVPTVIIILFHLVLTAFPSLEDRLMPSRVDATETSLFEQTLEDQDTGRSLAERQRVGIITILWVIAFPIMAFYVGFAYAIPVYVFAFVWYFRGSLRIAAAITVVFSVATYIFFIAILGMIPWAGELGLPNILNMLPF